MRIKTIEVQGFKSFVDRTIVHFEEGVTGVVGPNGCGKSNIVDAIRWVMGEQSAKHLRGGAMEDVIFSGAESRQPSGMAQVFMTFDNADGRAPAEYAAYSEIQIGRRLYRSGESEYFINKTPCRLKDIVDLFLGTGVGTKAYSIVEQGKVEQIVSSKPEDRRMLVEEAAGISKFRSRKEAALRKMESTKGNLSRLDDILGELGRQLNSLNRQVKKAERYQRVADELRQREMVLAATQYRSLSDDLKALEEKKDVLKGEEVAAAGMLSSEEADLDTARLEIAETERELDGVQQELYALQNAIKLAEATITHKKNERASLAAQNESFVQEVEELKARIAVVSEKLGRANDEKIAADISLAGSTGVVEEIEQAVAARRSERERVVAEVDEDKLLAARASDSVAHERSRVEDRERRAIDIQGRIAKNQSEIDGIDGREASIKKDKEKLESELAGARQLKLSLAEEHQSSASTLTRQRDNLRKAEESVQTLREDMSVKKSQLASLVELRDSLEGYRDGVRAVLERSREAQEEFRGVVGTVSDLVETDSAYECAVSAVLGDRLQGVVVKSQEEGISAIDYLKTASCGRSMFIPMNVRQASEMPQLPTGEGVVGPLANVVRFADDYRAVGNYLMGDVVLVDTLRRALGIWNEGAGTATIVTMDGEVIDPAGVVTGGAGGDGEERLVAQKRRIKELELGIAALTSELTRAEGELHAFRERVKNLEINVESLTKNSHNEEIKIVSQDRDVARLGDELKRYDHERDRLAVEIAALTDELGDVERDRDAAKARIDELIQGESAARERLTTAEARLKELSVALEAEEAHLLDSRVTFAKASEREGAADRELENLIVAKTEALVTMNRRAADITANTGRQAQLGREADALKQELDLNVRAIDGLQESRTALSEKYQQLTEGVRARELELREVRKRHTEMSNEMHAAELAFTEHRGKVNYLIASIRERYRVEITSAHADFPTPEELNADAEEVEVAELREKFDNIGSVNLDALQEYEDLKERFDFLNLQREDLALSMENLSKAIARINRTSRRRFRSTFEAVDAQFQCLFPKLFSGGKARLMLTDEENILETGVEIVAQPPGKKLQSITLLSGGEKALTAVALIFSIFLIKPSPFCLLDEVDAPLDDANIDRFNDLIRSMIGQSQFILITHNKRTMELADILYGVTMEEAGVSKIVSVKLNQGEVEPAVA